jgi:hypothetical protein
VLRAAKRLPSPHRTAAAQLLESIRHPNIVLFMGWCWRPHLAILSEFMHRGSLWALLRRGGNQPLEPRMQRSGARAAVLAGPPAACQGQHAAA